FFYLFFFSSIRRHTKFSRDWSSDVCSSDLLRRHLRISIFHWIWMFYRMNSIFTLQKREILRPIYKSLPPKIMAISKQKFKRHSTKAFLLRLTDYIHSWSTHP